MRVDLLGTLSHQIGNKEWIFPQINYNAINAIKCILDRVQYNISYIRDYMTAVNTSVLANNFRNVDLILMNIWVP